MACWPIRAAQISIRPHGSTEILGIKKPARERGQMMEEDQVSGSIIQLGRHFLLAVLRRFGHGGVSGQDQAGDGSGVL